MKLEHAFNRLCGSRHGWLMIPLVGAGFCGIAVLAIEIAKQLSR